MHLLLAAHADGAALQRLTPAGAPDPAMLEPRLVSASELPGVVRQLEQQRPRWIWHRTQDWYPALLAAGVELERCYDLTLCGAILAHSEFTAHTPYARNAEKLTQDDDVLQPPRALQPPPPPADQGALLMTPGCAPRRGTPPRSSAPSTPRSRNPWPESPPTATAASSGSSSCSPPSPPAP
jgi:DNA polymerase-1